MILLLDRIHRLRQGIVLAAAVLLLAFAVAWAHSGMAMDHMEAAKAASVCLAVMGAAGLLGVGLVAPERLPRARLRASEDPSPPQLPCPRAELPWARAGPLELQVFRC